MHLPKKDRSLHAPSRRALLRAGLAGAGGFGLRGWLEGSLGAAAAGEPEPAAATSICPIFFNGQFNGVYYYYAQECTTTGVTTTMTSTVPLSPLGCGPPNPMSPPCVPSFKFQSRSAPGISEAHYVWEEAREHGLKRFLPDDLPFPAKQGEVEVHGRPRDYRVERKGRAHVVRLFLVLYTPPGGTAHAPRPPALMGVGQEVERSTAVQPEALTVLNPHEDSSYLMLRRESDRVHFHALLKGT